MIRLILLASACLLAGCASVSDAGHTAYTVKPFAGPDGTLVCCEVQVRDGKEYSGRNIAFQTSGASFAMQISEGESKAFKGQAIGAKALTVLPVTGLPDLVK